MLVLAAASIFVAISLLAYGMLSRSVAPVAERRLATLANDRTRGVTVAREDLGPSRGEAVATMLNQFLPRRLLQRLSGFLKAAHVSTAPELVLVSWVGGALGLPCLYLLFASQGSGIGGQQKLLAGGLFVLTGYAPLVLLRGRIRRYRAKILKELPDMMDLLTICVEAGLGIDAGLAKVAEKAREPLADEVRIILRTMSMGRPRREALEQFADRTGLPEIISFTGAVIQAEKMGVSLGQVLRVQSDALRVQRKQRAEQKAFKAPVKIIVVLALLIFPSMFIVIMGPAALQLMNSGH